MANFDYPWDEPEEKKKPQPITTEPTTQEEMNQEFERLHREEAQQAFDEIFKESNFYLNKLMKGVFF